MNFTPFDMDAYSSCIFINKKTTAFAYRYDDIVEVVVFVYVLFLDI